MNTLGCYNDPHPSSVANLFHLNKRMVHFQARETKEQRRLALAGMIISNEMFKYHVKMMGSEFLKTSFRFSRDLQKDFKGNFILLTFANHKLLKSKHHFSLLIAITKEPFDRNYIALILGGGLRMG